MALKIFRYRAEDGGEPRVGIETFYGRYDLTGIAPEIFATLGDWLSQPDPVTLARVTVEAAVDPLPEDIVFLPPVDTQEIWASGVTYERSRMARQEESAAAGGGDFYDRVYRAERPELFFKSAGWRVAGSGQPIRIRKDSTWNVPEPEMTLVLSSAGKIVGVTVGNDVSSRSIEGENPLYLPQAKSYDGACAVGPMIALIAANSGSAVASLPSPPSSPAAAAAPAALNLAALTIKLEIRRGNVVAYSGETSTRRMKRTPEDLAGYLFRELSFPHGALLMTGTGLIPPDNFTLHSGDTVTITIAGVGTLVNTVA